MDKLEKFLPGPQPVPEGGRDMAEELIFSAPGRVELGGNHTDHQHGCVLAAAVDLECRAAVRPNGDGVIRLRSEGYAPAEVALDALDPRPEERGTTAALVRGMAAAFARRGCAPAGFDAAVSSQVRPGSGLSSSAAFEILLGRILNALSAAGRFSPEELAAMGQWAENVYFGKPCGLMDQMASSVGGLVYMDFARPERPLVRSLRCGGDSWGHAVYTVDCGADHAGLTEEYAAIPAELGAVSRLLGAQVLRQVDEDAFYADLPRLRAAAGDRAVLRAIHVFGENRRVQEEAAALEQGRFADFLALVNASGDSSWEYLQNVTPAGDPRRQAMALTLALCRRQLGGRGAARVHGGGFGGTVLALVPLELEASFRAGLESALGPGCCTRLKIRGI